MAAKFDVKVRGADKLLKDLKKIANPEKTFDTTIKKAAFDSLSRLIETTPKSTSRVARAWEEPKKKASAEYVVSNKSKTKTGIPIVTILDEGRGVVLPKRAKRLFIPLTTKGRERLDIKVARVKPLVYGVDYILAKKARAYSGTKFLTKELKKAANAMTRDIIKKIRRIIG